jgi:hypothetical protein
MDLSMVADIEQIKQLKARYFRLMDQKRWDEWANIFAEDVTAVYFNAPSDRPKDGLPELRCNGRTELVGTVKEILSKGISMHHGHMPEIEITSPTTARGIWAMFDYLRLPNCIYKGYGHYEEDYVKEKDGWKIKTILLTRLHCDIQWEKPAEANK